MVLKRGATERETKQFKLPVAFAALRGVDRTDDKCRQMLLDAAVTIQDTIKGEDLSTVKWSALVKKAERALPWARFNLPALSPVGKTRLQGLDDAERFVYILHCVAGLPSMRSRPFRDADAALQASVRTGADSIIYTAGQPVAIRCGFSGAIYSLEDASAKFSCDAMQNVYIPLTDDPTFGIANLLPAYLHHSSGSTDMVFMRSLNRSEYW
jgi:hypothetical protein